MPAVAEIGRAFRKCATAMKGGDAPKRLADALAKISQLRKRLAEIEQDNAEHSKRFSRHTAEKKAQFEASSSFEDKREYILAQVIENWYNEHAADPATRAKLLYGIQVLPTAESEAFETFVKEHPNWRTEVEAALSIKTEIAKQAYEETLATVREQLSEFDDDAVTNDPRVKRVRRELATGKGCKRTSLIKKICLRGRSQFAPFLSDEK